MTFLATRNSGAERLMGFGPLGFFFALILGHNGQLARTPLAVGGVLGVIGLAFKIAHHKTNKETI